MRYLPNFVSVLRILLVAPTAWFLWHNEIALALALMAVAGISDALDGALARRYNWQSHLGSILDPLADKFLVAITFLVFTFQSYKTTLSESYQSHGHTVNVVIIIPIREGSAFLYNFICESLFWGPDHTSFK